MKNILKKKGVKCVMKTLCFIISRGFLLFVELLAFTHLILYNDCFLKIMGNIYKAAINFM